MQRLLGRELRGAPGVDELWRKGWLLEEAFHSTGRCVPEQLRLVLVKRAGRGRDKAMEPHYSMQVVETMLDEAFEAHHGLPPSQRLLEAFAPFAHLRPFDARVGDKRLKDFRAFVKAHY